MADEAKEKDLELDNSGKKKKIIIIGAVVAILAIGGGAFMFLGGEPEVSQAELDAALNSGGAEASADGSSAAPTTGASAGTALYVPMPRPFRFNVPGAARDRFVEIRVQLLVRGADNEEAAKKHVPLIESTLLAVFSQSNADDLATSAGKTSLKQKSLAEVHKIMTDVAGSNIVEKVLFTGFVMQ
ncbi:flagellar basal body-associated protein FliL [Colwellia sp. 1_MG-2023]|uniref:flagellar basal body-associated protein FliL n=1 Tax=Colwellia sp. 1_MG-2023 TaxID=3062649 RepID=UPI0026E31246|nr:flagellar basal body-associated protein FliL [Colwellia sp. 1_MG-2023]MDO6444363.1 flagellar basal body-associated protein FliL [Colwellia sp. 1_MG-2023]